MINTITGTLGQIEGQRQNILTYFLIAKLPKRDDHNGWGGGGVLQIDGSLFFCTFQTVNSINYVILFILYEKKIKNIVARHFIPITLGCLREAAKKFLS